MPDFNPLDHPIILSQPLRVAPSTWSAHIPFAMFLMEVLRPSVVVELGTQYGVSYCAICQAVVSLRLNTRCYAVDTWQGDAHAGSYEEDVLSSLKTHHDPLYDGFSTLIRSTFDQALERFENGSIDLLHIDGLHTYDAVKHDFDTWLPKMSSRGVALFHDIAVRRDDFGVWKFWDEHKFKYPHFDFAFGNGLGGLVIGKEYPRGLDLMLKESDDLILVKEFFFALGANLEKEFLLSYQIAHKERELQEIHGSRAWKTVMLLRRIRSFWGKPEAVHK